MARTKQILSDGVRLNDYIATGVLAEVLPMPLVRAALERRGKETLRSRKLPREFLVYYVVAMALFSNVNLRSVLKALLEGLSYVFPSFCRTAACEAAISQGRERLGEEVMRDLAEAVCRPVAEADTKGAFYGRWRLVAIDGSDFDLPDEPEIAAEFPKHSNGVEYPNPQLRFVALVELGTRCMFAVAQGNDRDSEKALAERVIPRLDSGMLLLGDRYYMGYGLFSRVAATGAAVLFRAKANLALKPFRLLPDGSYLARIYRDRKDRKAGGGTVVRVVEYRVAENGRPGMETCRLVTSILDWEQAPAEELAGLYRERWGIETAFAELKTQLKLPGHSLRSKRPDLARQEFWGSSWPTTSSARSSTGRPGPAGPIPTTSASARPSTSSAEGAPRRSPSPLGRDRLRARWDDLLAEVAGARARRGTGRRAPRAVKRKTPWPRKPRGSRAGNVLWDILLVVPK